MRYLYFCIFLFGSLLVRAQEMRPLHSNPILQQYAAQERQASEQQLADRVWGDEKNVADCPDIDPLNNYLVFGEELSILFDTIGIGGSPEDGASLKCLNCDDPQLLGSVSLVSMPTDSVVVGDSTTFIFQPFIQYIAGSTIGIDTVVIEFCNDALGCSELPYYFVTQRAGQRIEHEEIVLRRGQGRLVQLPTSNFTGALSCATVASCSQDNYEGTPVFWISNSKPNEFFYGADAYSGRDTVCMILCDALAICDTFVTPFMVTGDTLSLPFMDDFSYDGPYPDTSLWMESDVFVNNTMAMQPPSLGVATFDGLDATGTPRFGGIGRSDVLTSNYLDLTKDNANLFLSFYLQKQGLGDRPEVADNFIVEFKKADGTWQQITAIPGVADGVPLGTLFDFEFLSYPVDEQYLYDGFQFRFSAVNGRQGMLDLWHIDYIRLETNADISNVNDVAFALAPPSILEDYTAMPWNHFFANPASLLRTSNTTALFNHLGETTSVDDSRLLITENTTETVLNATTLRNALNVPAQVFTAFEYSFNTSQVSEQLVELSLNRPFDVTTAYELEREGQSSLVPILRNDRTQSTTRFDNYFAYDDGTAESNIIAQNFSSLAVQVAVEFEAYVGDSLQAVQFNIPRATADIEQQLFNINIWWDRDSLGGTPNQTLLGVSPVYVDNVVDSLQAFITYPLDEAVFIPAGKFWIGWQQATECSGSRCIPIGYDRNTTAANRFNYFNTSGENTPSEWVSFDSLSSIAPGALMIRPVMGNIKPIATDEVLDTETWNADEILVQIYPNPTRDVIQIALSDNDYSDFQIQLFNTAGQQLVSMPLVSQLDLSVFPTGMYFVEIVNRNTGQRVHHKVLRSAN